jgi:hypothetical protein
LLLGPTVLAARANFNTAPNQPQRASYQTFLAAGFTAVTVPLTSAYNTGGARPVTGSVTSRVFKSGNNYAYLYQVSIANTIANTKNLIVNFQVTPWTTGFTSFALNKKMGAMPVYQIDQLGMAANTSGFTFFPGSGLQRMSSGQGVDGSFLEASFLFGSSSGLRRGTTSTILVAFSTAGPGIGSARLTVGGQGTGSASVPVYVPTPEPSTLLLLSLGGVGLLGLGLRRKKLGSPV